MPNKRFYALMPGPQWWLIAGVLVVVGLLAAGCGDSQSAKDVEAVSGETSAQTITDCYNDMSVNNYLVALVDDSGAQAGKLDEYMDCKYLAATLPPSDVVSGCYTTEGEKDSAGDPLPRDTNLYGLTLLKDSGAQAGLLDEYQHCQYLPAIRPPNW